MFLQCIKCIENENEGRYRDMNVFISGSEYPVTETVHIQAERRSS